MYITLRDINIRKRYRFDYPIEKTMIGLRSLNLWVGWYNISNESITCFVDNKTPKTVKLAPGLYSFNMLANFIMIEAPGVDVSASEPTGVVEINIPKGLKLSLSEGPKNLLGIYDSNPLNPDTYVGDVPIDFMISCLLLS